MTATRALRSLHGTIDCFVSPARSAWVGAQPMHDGLTAPEQLSIGDLALAYVAVRASRPATSCKSIACAAFALGFATCAMTITIAQSLYAAYQATPQ